MAKILSLSSAVLASCFAMTSMLHAETTPAEKTTPKESVEKDEKMEISKKVWLDNVAPLLPKLICKGFVEDKNLKQRFDELKMTYEQCVTNLPAITATCRDKIYSQIPDMVNKKSAGIWGRALGECIGKTFAESYLVPK